MSYLVANPEDRFSRDVAHFIPSYVCVHFPFGVWGRMWNSTVSVPNHCRYYMSHVTRKPVFGVCNQGRLKPACSATETS